MTKTEINKALKEIGFGFIKMRVNSYQDKTHPSKMKGLRGGSIGPMTVTDAHHTHNTNVIDNVKNTLQNIGGSVEKGSYDLTVSFPSNRGKLVYNFYLTLYPTYSHNEYDKSYQTYWLELSKN
jgi:hypothetical protein